jgi:hypothetical protein
MNVIRDNRSLLAAEGRSHEIDQIILVAKKKGARILGFTSAEANSGVGQLCERVAERYVGFGQRTLLLDLASGGRDDGRPGGVSDGETPLLSCLRPAAAERFRFGFAESLHTSLQHDFADYAKIVIQLPPMFGEQPTVTSTLQGAAICDSLFVVCIPGRDRRQQFDKMFASFRMVGIQVEGLVMGVGQDSDQTAA